jgi:hypothetical protein
MVRSRNAALVTCVLAAAFAPAALGQINKCQTKDGRTVYQESPCPLEDKASSLKKPAAGPSVREARAGDPSSSRKPEEDKALGNLMVIVSVERDCKQMTGRFASFDEMRKSCVGANMSMGLHPDNDPNNDPNYDYRLTARSGGFELSIAPRKPGLTGYFTDGVSVFENANGAASGQSKKLGPLPF